MVNSLSLLGYGYTDKWGNHADTDGKTFEKKGDKHYAVFQKPPRLISVEMKAMFPVVDAKGQPVRGEQEFMWLGTKVFTRLYEKVWVEMRENPEYFEDVRDANGRWLYRKVFDFSPTGERIEQIGALGASGEVRAIRTAEEHTRAVMSDRLTNLENLIKQSLEKNEAKVSVDETGLTAEEKTLWEKLKGKVGLAVIAFMVCFGMQSCSTQQSIARNGCTIHEFAVYEPVTSVDSVGFYIVCDNKALVKAYPNVAADLLKLSNKSKTPLP